MPSLTETFRSFLFQSPQKSVNKTSTKLPPTPFRSIGATGTEFFSGYLTNEEYLNDLVGQKAVEVYDKMRRNDSQVHGTLHAITLPIREARWYIEPASDDKQDVEVAEILENNLLQGMQITWDDFIRQVLTYLQYGFSIFEKVYKVEDGIVLINKLSPRLQKTLWKWLFDDKGMLTGIQQYTQVPNGPYKYFDIPIEKLLLFVNNQEGANYEGISVLRSAYKHWYIKDKLYKIDAIGHDRFASGVPWAKEPPEPNEADRNRVATILQNLHSRERSYIYMPYGWEMGILEKSGDNKAVMDSIKHHNEEIAKNVLAQFINLGTSETGSRALGESFEELFMLSLNATAGYIEDIVNRFIIRELCDYNWKLKNYPKLKHSRIMLNVTKYIQSLSDIGITISQDFDTENHIREIIGLPKINAEKQEENKIKNQKKVITKKEEKEGENESEKSNVQTSEDKISYSTLLADKKKKRELTELEKKICDFDSIEKTLDQGVEKFEKEIIKIKKQQAEQIARDVVNQDAQQVEARYQGKLADRLFEQMKKIYRKGKKDVREEILRQDELAKKKQLADEINPNMGDQEEVFRRMKEEAKAKARMISNDNINTGLFALYNQGRDVGKEELILSIETEINKAGTKKVLSLSESMVNQAYAFGRENQARKFSGRVQYAVRSAVLDGQTCSVCAPKDGVRFQMGDSTFMAPDPECQGGAKCRCVNIYITSDMIGEGLEGDTKSMADYQKDKKELERIKAIDTKAKGYKWGTKTKQMEKYIEDLQGR